MAAPTQVLNEDIRTLRADLHRLDVGLAEIRTELKVLVGVAKWGIGLIATTLIGSTAAGIYWAGGINSEVKHLGTEIAEIRKLTIEKGTSPVPTPLVMPEGPSPPPASASAIVPSGIGRLDKDAP